MTSRKRPRIAIGRLDELCAGLDHIVPAEPDTLFRREMLAKLWHKISAAMGRGCSIADIHAYLKKADIAFDCSIETIRRDLKTIAEDEAKKPAKKSRRKNRATPNSGDQSTAEAASTSRQTEEVKAADPAPSGPRTQPSEDAPATSATTQSKEVSAAKPGSSNPRATQTDEPAQADMFAAAESNAAVTSPGTRPKSGGGHAEPSSGKETDSRSLCVSTHGGEDR